MINEQEITMSVAIESTNSYVLALENVPEGGTSCGLPEYLMIGIRADIRTSDNSFAAVLNGSAFLRLEPLTDYVQAWVSDSEAIVRGNLKIDYEFGLGPPRAISPVLNLVYFPEGQQDTRLTLDIYALYGDGDSKTGRKNWISVAAASSFTGCSPDSSDGVCIEHQFDYGVKDTDTFVEDTP
jgi:hypothetical protein